MVHHRLLIMMTVKGMSRATIRAYLAVLPCHMAGLLTTPARGQGSAPKRRNTTPPLAEAAFGVTINRYLYRGRVVYSNDGDPVLPAGLASKLVRVRGLDSLTQRFARYLSGGGTLYDTHRDSGPRTIFQGPNGPTDNPPGTCVVLASVQGSKGCTLQNGSGGSSLEAQLDAVMISSTANDAHIVNYMVNNLTVDSFTTMYQYIADHAADIKVVSTSWGLCVGNTPDSTIANDDAALLEADTAGPQPGPPGFSRRPRHSPVH
jgi:hypothetical protein